MVEAVAVLPMFVVVFAAIVFVGEVYKQNMRALRTVNEKVWMAVDDCSTAMEEDKEVADQIQNTQAGASKTGSQSKLNKSFGSVSMEELYQVKAGALLGGWTKHGKQSMRVMCNEQPASNNLFDLIKAAYHNLTNW